MVNWNKNSIHQVLIYTKKTYRKPSEKLPPTGGQPASHPNPTKSRKTQTRRKQHKNQHQNIKQFGPPQKYRPRTISNL